MPQNQNNLLQSLGQALCALLFFTLSSVLFNTIDYLNLYFPHDTPGFLGLFILVPILIIIGLLYLFKATAKLINSYRTERKVWTTTVYLILIGITICFPAVLWTATQVFTRLILY
jgi:hypothetical protein